MNDSVQYLVGNSDDLAVPGGFYVNVFHTQDIEDRCLFIEHLKQRLKEYKQQEEIQKSSDVLANSLKGLL